MKVSHFSQYPSPHWRWPNFSPRELASKREGELLIDAPAMDKLQTLPKTATGLAPEPVKALPPVIDSVPPAPLPSPASRAVTGPADGALYLIGALAAAVAVFFGVK